MSRIGPNDYTWSSMLDSEMEAPSVASQSEAAHSQSSSRAVALSMLSNLAPRSYASSVSVRGHAMILPYPGNSTVNELAFAAGISPSQGQRGQLSF